MTVTYTGSVATSSGFNFLLLLFRWRGGIYKLIWVELLIFVTFYISIALTYRLAMNEGAQKSFENVVYFCEYHVKLIPLSFVLAFFVTIVMGRWWSQYTTIPWPDSVAIYVSSSIHGQDSRARKMRRTILRYACLCQVIVFQMISPRVKQRFPTYKQIVEAGLMLENERLIFEHLDIEFPLYPKHWMPIVWAASIVMRARREGKIRDDYAVKTIIDELNRFRGFNSFLLYYDWVSVPLVYTQVVTLVTYTYFLGNLIGQQWIDDENNRKHVNFFDQYFPIFSIFHFFFYMGWLKVAETLINPFGNDDDDFELNWMIDRNLTVSYLIVDEMHQEHPELVKDQYWDQVADLPYTNEAQRQAPPEASTARLDYTKSGYFIPALFIPKDQQVQQQQQRQSMLAKSNRVSGRQSVLATATASAIASSSSSSSTTSFRYYNREDGADGDGEGGGATVASPGGIASMNFEDLKAERIRERRERMRSNYLNMRTSPPTYTVTVLHPPTPSTISSNRSRSRTKLKSKSTSSSRSSEEIVVKQQSLDAKKPEKQD